jgi:hypothetical protein
VAKDAQVPYDALRAAFFELPPFGLDYVKGLLHLLRKRNVLIAPAVKGGLKKLGKAYSQYTEDMIEFDTLHHLTEELQKTSQAIQVQILSKSWKKNIPIIRIINTQPNVKLRQQQVFPAIGYVPENVGDPLDAPFVKKLKEAYEQLMCVKWKEVWPEKSEDGCQIGEVCSERRNDTKILLGLTEGGAFRITERHIKDIKLILRSIEVGKGEHCQKLSAHLQKVSSDITFLKDFEEELADYVTCLGETFGENAEDLENLHCRVLTDMQNVVVKHSSLVARNPQTSHRVLGEILEFLNDYPVSMPAREIPKDQRKAVEERSWQLLRNDILGGNSDYLVALKYDVRFVEAALHDLWAPEYRKAILAVFSDSVGVVMKWLLFGLVHAHDVGGYFRVRGYHSYVNKRLVRG